jgi:hypothetical protein
MRVTFFAFLLSVLQVPAAFGAPALKGNDAGLELFHPVYASIVPDPYSHADANVALSGNQALAKRSIGGGQIESGLAIGAFSGVPRIVRSKEFS